MSRRALWSGFVLVLLSAVAFSAGHAAEPGTSVAWPVKPSPGPGFKWMAATETGLRFTNRVDELSMAANRVLEGGAGVAIGDYDQDGKQDLFFCSLTGDCRLFRNEGSWRFTETTVPLGLNLARFACRGALFGDLNGDRFPDLLVSTVSAGVLCLMNERGLRLSEQTSHAGLRSESGSSTMALADVDGNGTLDLYVTNYRARDIRDQGRVDLKMVGGKLIVPPALQDRLLIVSGRVQEYGEPDQLYLNDGTGRFRAVPWTTETFVDEAGRTLARPPLDWGLSAAFRDLNDDGAPDLYVCNDYWTPDRIWMNDGKGRFRALGRAELRHTSASSMGVDFADLDRDGWTDFLVVDMLSRDRVSRITQAPAFTPPATRIGEIYDRPQINRNTLFRGRGDGSFEEIAEAAGLAASDWSWQPLCVDVDLDGLEDVLIVAGHVHDVQDRDANERLQSRPRLSHKTEAMVEFQGRSMPYQQAFTLKRMEDVREYPVLEKPIHAFRNLGRMRFEEVTAAWGLNVPGIHHGAAMGDLDNDGDLDLVVNRLNAVAAVFRNESAAGRVSVVLQGSPPNTEGIGAKVTLWGGAHPRQSQEMMAGGKYLSGAQAQLVFGTGNAPGGMTLEVAWRGGSVTVVSNVAPNTHWLVPEAAASRRAPAKVVPPNPLFEDWSQRLGHVHRETPFDDFAFQPLLSKRLSQMGPGVCWFDLDGDGDDDLCLGGGPGSALALFRNDRTNGFTAIQSPPFHTPATRDQLSIVGFPGKEPGAHSLLVAESNYEDGAKNGAAVAVYGLGQSNPIPAVPSAEFAVGAMALADVRGVGALDLFVAGRPARGQYPEGGTCRLFRLEQDRWSLDTENSRVLGQSNMLVNGAVWSDLDQDGYPELVLACEWGPIRVFHNRKGRLHETTEAWGLGPFTGWWNGVTTADLDGDGQLEIIASNWGWNTPYQASLEAPLTLYSGDFGQDGIGDLIETEADPQSSVVGARRPLPDVAWALPDLRDRFASHRAFAAASVEQILGPHAWAMAKKRTVTTLASTVFFRQGDRFVPRPLPDAAQMSPAFAITVADFDGDSFEDVFLSQNFFATYPWLSRMDAGRGLLLRGDGQGGLAAVEAGESGIRVDGEQRGAAASDFDQDGRVDLVVSQNGAATKLYRNRGARPGIRVRLVGPKGNAHGVGATLRLVSGGKFGPAREVHAGSGYLSHDGLTPVMTGGGDALEVWVRWPGGKTSVTKARPVDRLVTVPAPIGSD